MADLQYFSDIMLARTQPMELVDSIRIIGKPRLRHAIVRTQYTLFDLDLSNVEIDFESIKNHDNGLYLFNLAFNTTFTGDTSLILDGDWEHTVKYDADLFREGKIIMRDNYTHELSGVNGDGLYLKHEIDYIRYLINREEYDPKKYHPNLQLCYIVDKYPDETLLDRYNAIDREGYERRDDHNDLIIDTLFTVDHDIPKCAYENPVLLMMFTKATTDEILTCFANYKHNDPIMLQCMLYYRRDIKIKFEIEEPAEDGDVGGYDYSLESSKVHLYGPNTHFILDCDNDFGFCISVDNFPSYMREMDIDDITQFCPDSLVIKQIENLSLNDIFIYKCVKTLNGMHNIRINPSGMYYSEDRTSLDIGYLPAIWEHRSALKYILNCHRCIRIMKKHFLPGIPAISEIIAVYYAGDNYRISYPEGQ